MKKQQKGKLDRSASVNIGGTIYNVHPQVQKSMAQMYSEGYQAMHGLQEALKYGEKQLEKLEEILKIIEATDVLPLKIIQWAEDVKDLLKEIKGEKQPEVEQKDVTPDAAE